MSMRIEDLVNPVSSPVYSNHLAPEERRVPIWLDCDTGHDDAFAILLAARNPRIKLLGISTVYGNASLEHTTYNTRAILKALGREDIPVYVGASRPLYREPAHAPDIHGETGLDGTTCLPVPTVPVRDGDAAWAMRQALSNEAPGTAWIVATGALTNICNLFTSTPQLPDHLAGLSIMGGAFDDGFTDAPLGYLKGEGDRFGNITPYAEFNIYCDPEAASAIFGNPSLSCKTTLIPLDITHKFIATSEIQIRLLFGNSSARHSERTMDNASIIRRLFFEIINYFSRTYADVFGLRSGPPTHDPLAVAVGFASELFSFMQPSGGSADQREERFAVTEVTAGDHGVSNEVRSSDSQCGRTIMRLLGPNEPGIRIPRTLEAKELWLMLETALASTETALELVPPDKRRKASSADPEGVDPAFLYSTPQEYIKKVMAMQEQDRVNMNQVGGQVERQQHRLASWGERMQHGGARNAQDRNSGEYSGRSSWHDA